VSPVDPGAEITIVGADALVDMCALEGTAEAIFGRGARQPGWFARKLIREGVEARLSAVAVPAGGPEPGDDQLANIVGYALLGRAPSLAGIARGSGVGVIAAERGRGVGGRLLRAVRERAGAAGCAAIEFLAEPERLAWYRRHGFAVVEEQLTLIAPGLGPLGPHAAPRLGSSVALERRGPALWSWVPEVWDLSPAHQRAYLEREGARLWLTREGRAWLVHRCELADPHALIPALTALRRELPPTTPLLLYPYPAAGASLPALIAAGFGPAQRSFVVRQNTT
jgi:ribosomal protein S18 acetylase RimI-like enzyme